jgi:hypothetical protein
MANSRIYMGNKDTLDYFFIGKGYGASLPCRIGDDERDGFVDKLNTLFSWSNINDVGEKSPILIFTEYDDVYDKFIADGNIIESGLDDLGKNKE